jgi:hypothetical protein
MSNRLKDKNRRARMSLQNRELFKNQMNKIIDNMGLKKNEPEVTEEEDPLKFFSQQQRKKEKEEERKKYLLPISEEDDPLKYFENKNDEEKELDPLKFVKKESVGEAIDFNLAKHDEEKLATALENNDIPEEVIVNKKEEKEGEKKVNKEQLLARRMKTALRLSQRSSFEVKPNTKLLQRIQESIKAVTSDNIVKPTGNEAGGNTLLGPEAQVDPAKNPTQPTTKMKEIDLGKILGDKPKKNE